MSLYCEATFFQARNCLLKLQTLLKSSSPFIFLKESLLRSIKLFTGGIFPPCGNCFLSLIYKIQICLFSFSVPKDYFVSLDIRNLGLKAATVVFSIDGELQQIEMPSLDIKQKELTIRSSVRPAAVRIIALDSITKSAIDINGKASIDVTPTLEKISTVVSFGEGT